MSISSPSKHGPNISQGSEIKFSTLRKYFMKMNPKSNFNLDDDDDSLFDTEDEPVSASQLLRKTEINRDDLSNLNAFSTYDDFDKKSPFVPDSTENANISISSNWKLSQFVGSAKYYYINQTSLDTNVIVDNLSWNDNLHKPIRKIFFIDGTIGSTESHYEAITTNGELNNFSFIMSSTGNVHSSGGERGTRSNPSYKGGTAISFKGLSNSGGKNIYIYPSNDSQIYAGGGGGGRGGNGGNGGAKGREGDNRPGCPAKPAQPTCANNITQITGPGESYLYQEGGNGKGYLNDDISPGYVRSDGTKQAGGHVRPGGGAGNSGASGAGGAGGDWAEPGETGKSGSRGNPGGMGFIVGGSCKQGRNWHTCDSSSNHGEQGKAGRAGLPGSPGGHSISSKDTYEYRIFNRTTSNFNGNEVGYPHIDYVLPYDYSGYMTAITGPDNTSNVLGFSLQEHDQSLDLYSINVMQQSISANMRVVCDTQGVISQFTKITAIQRPNPRIPILYVTVTPFFNAFGGNLKFNFYS